MGEATFFGLALKGEYEELDIAEGKAISCFLIRKPNYI